MSIRIVYYNGMVLDENCDVAAPEGTEVTRTEPLLIAEEEQEDE